MFLWGARKFFYILNNFFVWNIHFHKLRLWPCFWGCGKITCKRCTSYTIMTLKMCDHVIEYDQLLCNSITSSIQSSSNKLNLKHLCQKKATFINAATQHWQGSCHCTVPPFTSHTLSTLLKILVHFYLPVRCGISAFFYHCPDIINWSSIQLCMKFKSNIHTTDYSLHFIVCLSLIVWIVWHLKRNWCILNSDFGLNLNYTGLVQI